jgi:hypothetical protein
VFICPDCQVVAFSPEHERPCAFPPREQFHVVWVYPESAITGLVEALEGIARNFDNVHFLADQESLSLGAEGNHLGEHEAKGIASTARNARDQITAALSTFKQEVG